METSPFVYGVTVSEKAFTNRESESKKLFSNLTQGVNTTIISPRRWGKSSLVEKVVKDINRQEPTIKIVLIDLFSVSGEEEFLELFAREVIKASSSKWQDWMQSGKDFFTQLLPKLSVGVDPVTDFSLSFDWQELKRHKDEILNLPEQIAKKKNIRFIVCLDEFQQLANFSDYENLEKRMRAAWQRQKRVTYCLFGSKRHMLADIFSNPSKPFYRFGDIMWLPKIDSEKWTYFIQQSFRQTHKSISNKLASAIASLMKNNSWYVQQLAHYTWQKTENKVSTKEIAAALSELINANTPLYQNEIESFSTTQLNLLKAVVSGERKFTSRAVMEKYRIGTPRNVSKNKTRLIYNDIIHETDQGYEFLDPAFELWFLKQYYNKDFTKKL